VACLGLVAPVHFQNDGRGHTTKRARQTPRIAFKTDEARCVAIEVREMDSLVILIAFALGFVAGYGVRERKSQMRRRHFSGG
jgi:hypothetical protein